MDTRVYILDFGQLFTRTNETLVRTLLLLHGKL